jgi:hypothetical protein
LTLHHIAPRIALALAALYLCGVAVLFLAQRQLIYYPSQRAPAPTEAGFADATEIALTAADGTRILLW